MERNTINLLNSRPQSQFANSGQNGVNHQSLIRSITSVPISSESNQYPYSNQINQVNQINRVDYQLMPQTAQNPNLYNNEANLNSEYFHQTSRSIQDYANNLSSTQFNPDLSVLPTNNNLLDINNPVPTVSDVGSSIPLNLAPISIPQSNTFQNFHNFSSGSNSLLSIVTVSNPLVHVYSTCKYELTPTPNTNAYAYMLNPLSRIHDNQNSSSSLNNSFSLFLKSEVNQLPPSCNRNCSFLLTYYVNEVGEPDRFDFSVVSNLFQVNAV